MWFVSPNPQPGRPFDDATAGEFMLTLSSIVTAGGVRTANFPVFFMKSRRPSKPPGSAFSSLSVLLVMAYLDAPLSSSEMWHV
jgi:hypothetical protein